MSEKQETVHRAGDVTIKDSGVRRVFESGAQRDAAEGKGAFELLPYYGLLEVAQVFEAGAKKYRPNNYRLGMALSKYVGSGLRHAFKASQGWTDENHAAQCAWNFLALIETRQMIRDGKLPKELDDLPDWLTNEGAAKAMADIRALNEIKEKPANTLEK